MAEESLRGNGPRRQRLMELSRCMTADVAVDSHLNWPLTATLASCESILSSWSIKAGIFFDRRSLVKLPYQVIIYLYDVHLNFLHSQIAPVSDVLDSCCNYPDCKEIQSYGLGFKVFTCPQIHPLMDSNGTQSFAERPPDFCASESSSGVGSDNRTREQNTINQDDKVFQMEPRCKAEASHAQWEQIMRPYPVFFFP